MANHGYCYKCKWFQPIKENEGFCEFQNIQNDFPKEVNIYDYCPDYVKVNKNSKNIYYKV